MNDMTYRKSFTIAMCERHMLMYVKKNSWKKSVAAKSKKSSSAFLREFRRARIHRNVKKKKKDLTPKKKKKAKKSLHTKIQKKKKKVIYVSYVASTRFESWLTRSEIIRDWSLIFKMILYFELDFFRLTLNEERCWCHCLSKIVHCTASIGTWVFRIDILHVQSDVSEIVHRCYTISY